MPRSSAKSPASPYPQRLARLRQAVAAAGADEVLITNPIDVGYLTGFTGGDSYLLVSSNGHRPVVISDFRYQEELEPVRGLAEIVIRKKGITQTAAEVAKDRGGHRLAIQPEHLTVGEADALGKFLGKGKLVPVGGLVGALRIKKDEVEIGLIKKAIRIQEDAFEAILPRIKAGRTELEIAAELEAEMKSRGSSEPGFQTIVAAGASGALPHYRPTTKKLVAGKPVLIDWGAVYGGYHGDMTRVLCLGPWPKKIREIYGIVLEAHERAAAALAPGKRTHEIDAIARAHIAQAGYGEQFGHGLGHGMGRSGHEDPRLHPMYADMVLEPGHVVTIEPGIYLPGTGGVRIEDDYLVTERGAKNLCSLPRDLEWGML